MSVIRDGHIHSPFCPHGSSDSFNQYIERAISENIQTVSFTEHAPLPAGFEDPVPDKDSALPYEKLSEYLSEIEKYKKEYRHDIEILSGLEVDYIEGFEKETKSFLNEVGPMLDDSILSVHFLKAKDQYVCLDYSPGSFSQLIERTGSLSRTVQLYFDTLRLSIESDLGPYKPKRLGHMTLIRKFHQRFPGISVEEYASWILDLVKDNDMELDYNGAGTAKRYCGEPYPPHSIALEAKKRGIPLVYGSDAHQEKDMMQGADRMITF